MAKVKPILDTEALEALAAFGRKFNEAMREAVLQINRNLREAQRRRLMRALNPSGLSEYIFEREYQRRIERERRLARMYLRRIVAEKEKELGLKPEFDPRRKATK